MKKRLIALLLAAMLLAALCFACFAEPVEALPPNEAAEVIAAPDAEPAPDPTRGPWTWAYLASIAGATAATLLIVQYLKVPLDRVWKIPTRAFVYAVAFVILTSATAFTSDMNLETITLCVLNAFVVALAAYGSYELTFARAGK